MTKGITNAAFVARSDAKPVDYFTELQADYYTHIVLKNNDDYIGVLDITNLRKYPETRIFEDMSPDTKWERISSHQSPLEVFNDDNINNGYIVCDNDNNFLKLIPNNNSHNNKFLNLKNEYNSYLKFLKHELLNIANGLHGLKDILSIKDEKILNDDEFSILEIISSKIIEFSEIHLSINNKNDFKDFIIDTHINSIIKNAILTVKSEALLKDVEIHLDITESECLSLSLNSIYFFQIIINILINAIRYSPNNSAIKVITRIKIENLQLIISDSGKGISNSEQEKIFTKHFRGTSSKKINGSGLGLHVVKNFSECINAECGINSPPKHFPVKNNKGTEFWLNIPLVR